MAVASHGGLSSSRWAVSPATGPKDENTYPASNRVVSDGPQVQANVHDRVTNMFARRPSPVESEIPKIVTHEHHSKPLQENIPTDANTVSKDAENHKAQGHISESAQNPLGQVHNARSQSANVQPAQVQSTQAQAVQTSFRPVQEMELFQVCSQTNDDEQHLEQCFMKNLKKDIERITGHNQELESKRVERSVKFKLEGARQTFERQTEDKQGSGVVAPGINPRQIKDILKSNIRIETKASKHTKAISDAMPTDRASPQVQAVGVPAIMDKPSTKTGKMARWDMQLKKCEEAREKLEFEYQKWVTGYEQERATLVRNREAWIVERLEAEKARVEAQEMIAKFDQEIEDRDMEYVSNVSTYQKFVKNLCIEMACLAVSR